MSTLVLLNPAAGGGRAERRWARVAGAVPGPCRVVRLTPGWEAALEAAIGDGAHLLLAAGGDGTVGTLADAAMRLTGGRTEGLVLGAIGLGSSNDFHRPLGRWVAGVPLRADPASAVWRDLGRARWCGPDGAWRERVFAVSASLGLLAEGNARFGGSGVVMRGLRRRCTPAAIGLAALQAVASHRNLAARVDGSTIEVTALWVAKTPWVSGGLCSDLPGAPDDGALAVALCVGLTRSGALGALAGMARGRFLGRPGCHGWPAERVEVELERDAPLELDGELVRARRVVFEVVPRAMRVCA